MSVEQMDDGEVAGLVSSLSKVISKWWDRESAELGSAPWIGDKTYYLMALSAVAILQASKDTEVYLDSQEMLK